MRHLLLLLGFLLTAGSLYAQAPAGFTFQAVVRDASDELVTNTTVGMQISILQGSPTGTAVYVEVHTPTTNANGLASIQVGSGNTIGIFSAIDWANGPYFIKSETDPAGGTNYTISGTQQLLSVPYALHAGNTHWETDGTDVHNTNSGNVGIGTDQPTSALDIDGEVRIRGGAPGEGKVLTSAADGSATWQSPSVTFQMVLVEETLSCLSPPCWYNNSMMATCPVGFVRVQVVDFSILNDYHEDLDIIHPADNNRQMGVNYSYVYPVIDPSIPVKLRVLCIGGVPYAY